MVPAPNDRCPPHTAFVPHAGSSGGGRFSWSALIATNNAARKSCNETSSPECSQFRRALVGLASNSRCSTLRDRRTQFVRCPQGSRQELDEALEHGVLGWR